MRYLPHSPQDRADMLTKIGVASIDDLFADIPKDKLIDGLPDSEFCKTYFSSVTRKLFATVGVAPDIEFIATDLDPLANVQEIAVTRRFAAGDAAAPAFAEVLGEDWFGTPWAADGGNVAKRSIAIIACPPPLSDLRSSPAPVAGSAVSSVGS